MKRDAKADGKSDANGNENDNGMADHKAAPTAKSSEKSDAIPNTNSNENRHAKPERAKGHDCVLCGCCLELCPLFAATNREELSPRAKALLSGPSKFTATGQQGGLDDDAVAELASLCLACGKCEKLCPQGVSVPRLVARLRAEHPDFRQWLWRQWVTRLAPYWSLAAKGAALVPESVVEALAPAGLGLALKGLRGLRPGNGLRPWLTITKFPVEEFRARYGGRPVVLFDGCVGAVGVGPRKAWGDTARFLLRGLGANLVEADFSCCGSTLGVAGLPEDQLTARRANVEAWRKAGRPLLVTYCATCRKGLADYAGPGAGSEAGAGLFADTDEKTAWAAAVTPLAALLSGATAKVGRGAPAAIPAIVGWHRPCHAEPDDADFRLLSSLLGARLRTPAKANCCGFGGIMQLSAPKLSTKVGQACWNGLDTVLGFTAAPEVVSACVLTGCSGCVMQLAATAPTIAGKTAQVGHWLESIAKK